MTSAQSSKIRLPYALVVAFLLGIILYCGWSAWESLRPRTTRDMIERATTGKDWERAMGIYALSESVGEQEVLDVLIAGLRDESELVRGVAAMSIGRAGPPAAAAVPVLVGATKDASRDVRLQAIYALADVGPTDERTVQALIEALADPSVGESACLALILLVHDHPGVSSQIERGLSEMGRTPYADRIRARIDWERLVERRRAQGDRWTSTNPGGDPGVSQGRPARYNPTP